MNALQLQKLDRLKARLKQTPSPIQVHSQLILNGEASPMRITEVFPERGGHCYIDYPIPNTLGYDCRAVLHFTRYIK